MQTMSACPCPKLQCPNHGHCDKCISRHVRLGFLNYCSFHTILPTLQQVIDGDPHSPAAQKLGGLLAAQLQAYARLIQEHGLAPADQNRLLKEVAAYSDH